MLNNLVFAAGRFVPSMIGFGAIVFYSHNVSPKLYGEYAAALAIANIANMFGFQWIRVSLTRGVSAGLAEVESFSAIALRLYATAFVLSFILAILAWNNTYFIYCILMTFSLALSDLTLEFHRARSRALAYSLQYLFRQILIFGISLTVLHQAGYWNPIIAGFVLGNLLSAIISGRKLPLQAFNTVTKEDWRNFMHYGLPLSMTYGISGVLNNVDRLVVSVFLGPTAAGMYALPADIAKQLVMTVMEGANLGALPQALRSYDRGGPEAARKVLRRNFTLLLAVGAPAAAGLAAIAPSLSPLLLGASFGMYSALIIQLIAAATLIRCLRIFYFDQSFHISRATIYSTVSASVAAAIMTAASITGALYLGVLGVAASALVASGLSLLVSVYMSARVFPMQVDFRDTASIGICSLFMAFLIYFVLGETSNFKMLALQIFAGAVAYSSAFLALNVGTARSFALGWLKEKIGA